MTAYVVASCLNMEHGINVIQSGGRAHVLVLWGMFVSNQVTRYGLVGFLLLPAGMAGLVAIVRRDEGADVRSRRTTLGAWLVFALVAGVATVLFPGAHLQMAHAGVTTWALGCYGVSLAMIVDGAALAGLLGAAVVAAKLLGACRHCVRAWLLLVVTLLLLVVAMPAAWLPSAWVWVATRHLVPQRRAS